MGRYGTTKNAERVSVDLSLGRQVREQRGTKNRTQVKNPTRNPTRFMSGQSQCEITSHINAFKGIQQNQDSSNKI